MNLELVLPAARAPASHKPPLGPLRVAHRPPPASVASHAALPGGAGAGRGRWWETVGGGKGGGVGRTGVPPLLLILFALLLPLHCLGLRPGICGLGRWATSLSRAWHRCRSSGIRSACERGTVRIFIRTGRVGGEKRMDVGPACPRCAFQPPRPLWSPACRP